jgi:organic radical activating enzyme
MNKITIPFVEYMITRVCNLVCPGCSTYSDLASKGYIKWADGKKEIEPWLERVHFEDFGIMGGEPLINPEVEKWITGIRELMPNTVIRFPTNGTLLSKKLELIDTLYDVGNCIIKITDHIDNDNVQQSIEYIRSKYNWKPITEFGIDRWVTKNNVKFQVNRPEKFYKTFRNDYANAMPYDSDPQAAFDVCHQKMCPLLINGRIYKCSTSGLMKSVLERFENPNISQWEPYLDNNNNGSISLDSTDDEIQKFSDNCGVYHNICQQCPSKDTIEAIEHRVSVTFR